MYRLFYSQSCGYKMPISAQFTDTMKLNSHVVLHLVTTYKQSMQTKTKCKGCSTGMSCKSWQVLWRTIPVVRQIWFAMIWHVWIVDIILWCLVLNIDHLVKHATLSFITDNVLSQSINAPLSLFPQLLMSTSACAYPQTILQTVKSINNILHSLRLSITKTVNYSSTARLQNMLMWLQKLWWWPESTKHHTK